MIVAFSYLFCIGCISGLDKLEYLQSHTNRDIYKKAYGLIDKYFSHEEGQDEIADIAPAVNQGQFTFNIPDSTTDNMGMENHLDF